MRMTKKERLKYKRKYREIERRGEILQRKRELKEKRDSYKPKRQKISTSKLYMALVIGISIEISIFIQYVTLKFGDTSCLYALAAIPVGSLAIPLVSYFRKSVIENSAGGIVYDMAMRNEMSNNIVVENIEEPTEGMEENSGDSCIVEIDNESDGVG